MIQPLSHAERLRSFTRSKFGEDASDELRGACSAGADALEREGEIKSRVDCLAMFVRRLKRKLKKYEPDTEVLQQADTYLRSIGQAGTPLRAEEASNE